MRLGVKQPQNQRAGLQRRRWPESPSMGRSYESRMGTGRPPPPNGMTQEAGGLWACVGNWEAPPQVKGPPLPSRRVPDNRFISELEEGQGPPIVPHNPDSAPRGGEERARGGRKTGWRGLLGLLIFGGVVGRWWRLVRGHVDVVWVARVVIGAGSCFRGLGFSCENTHTRDEPQRQASPLPPAALQPRPPSARVAGAKDPVP